MLYKCQASIILNICVRKNFKEIKFSERNRSHDLRVCFLTSESKERETLKKSDDRDKRHGHIVKFCNEVVLRYSEWDQFPRSILGLFVCVLSHLVVSNSFVIPWAVAHQAPLSMGFSRQEYWSGLPFPSPGELPDAGIQPRPPASAALAGEFFTTAPPGKPPFLACAVGNMEGPFPAKQISLKKHVSPSCWDAL